MPVVVLLTYQAILSNLYSGQLLSQTYSLIHLTNIYWSSPRYKNNEIKDTVLTTKATPFISSTILYLYKILHYPFIALE
jgi:hypothetical protein